MLIFYMGTSIQRIVQLPDKLFEILKTLNNLNVEILSINNEITRLAFDFMQKGFGIFDTFHASTAKYYDLTIVSTSIKMSV